MSVLQSLHQSLRLPVIGAPMFLVSGPDLVIAQCTSGIIGTFPSLNARPQEALANWIVRIKEGCTAYQAAHPDARVGPFGVNLIVHPSNPRWRTDLQTCVDHQVPLIITSLHAPDEVVRAVHPYGGLVFHDVTTVRHAKRALQAGVDGLILVTAGAGGHAGTLNPIALVNEIRAFYDGPLILSGCISHGKDILAAQALGCDFAYMGTRFIATEESLAPEPYRNMIVTSTIDDILYTPFFSGVPANYLIPSIEASGLDITQLQQNNTQNVNLDKTSAPKAWKEIWGAGQGVGATQAITSTRTLVNQLVQEYGDARRTLDARLF
jgi:nitronate monooxygenase